MHFPSAAAGVPYSAVVYAVNGAGRGAESERVTFFSKELGKVFPWPHALHVTRLTQLAQL